MRTGHVGLNVADVARALPLCTGAFGWDVLGESDDPAKTFAFLGDGDGIVGGIVPHSEGGGSGGIFFTDPDGIRLEIYAADGAHAHGAAPAGAAPTCGLF